MSDYKSLRLKKTKELEAAISSFRKDLYEWKAPENIAPKRSLNNNNDTSSSRRQTPSFPAPPARIKPIQSTLSLKRTNSLKDLASPNSSASSSRPLTSATPKSGKKSSGDPSRIIIVEDLSDSSLNDFEDVVFSRPAISSALAAQTNDRPYLNTARGNILASPRPATFRDPSDREAELVSKLNQKDALTVFEIDLSQLKLTVMKNLQKFPNLKVIDFSCNHIKKIENLNFKNLIELKLFANEIEVLENLDNLPELLSLQLQSNQIKSINKSLCNLKKLEYLRLDRNKLTSISSSELSPCHNLIYLDVSFNKLESIAFINYLPNLEELSATNLELKKLNDLDASRCPSLSELDLSHNQLTEEQISSLANFSNLISLKISNNGLKSVKNISNIKSLRYLDISNNQIELISDLVTINDLESLNASDNSIRDWFQIEILLKCSELSDLNVKDNPVMFNKQPTDVLKALPKLKFINEIAVKSLEKGQVKKVSKQDIDDALFQFDYGKFEQEAKLFDEKIFKKLGEIKEILDTMNRNEFDSSSSARSASANDKRFSKNRLMDALSFSKNQTASTT